MTAAARCRVLSRAAALTALSLFWINGFAGSGTIHLLAEWVLAGALLAAWGSVLVWRPPVFPQHMLLLIFALWAAGTGLSVWLAGWAHAARPVAWRLSHQGVALGLSLLVGGLLLRALLRKRTAPAIGRMISLISPLLVLLVAFFSLRGEIW